MTKKLCHCGASIPNGYNSTIQAKECPKCAYLTAMGKKKNPVKGEKKTRAAPVPWREKSTADMINYVQEKIVNPYIRERDEVNFGVSISDHGKISDAGHYFSRGAVPGMRFNVQNIHGQSKSGNMYKSGDLINYRAGLIKRHGLSYVDELEAMRLVSCKAKNLDRLNVLIIAETYLYLSKAKIWVFRHVEFEKYKQQWIDGKENNR